MEGRRPFGRPSFCVLRKRIQGGRIVLKRRHFTALVGATALSAPMVARGQARWKPEKPITIYNPFAAGGVTDVHIRMLGETVTKVLGQQVIVDVEAGAAGTLSPAMLLTPNPDGQTP